MVLRSFGRVGRRPATCLAAAAVGVMLAALPASAQQAGPAAQQADADPKLVRIPLASLCQLSVTDGQLVFTSRVPIMSARGGRSREIDVPGLPGSTTISYRGGTLDLDNTHRDPAGRLVSLSISRTRGRFDLQREVRGAGGIQSMSLTQTYSDDGTFRGGSGHVRLVVNGRIVGEADDFEALRRENPGPFYAHVVPALRELRGDGLLEVDPWAARQVLADRVPAEDVPAAVRRLVGELSDPAAKTREAAFLHLAGLGQAAADALKRLDRESLSPQQSMAVEVLLKKHKTLPPADADRLRDDPDFLVDCLYSEDTDIPPAALTRLQQLTGRAWRPELAGRAADRGDVVEALRAEVRKSLPATRPTTRPDE